MTRCAALFLAAGLGLAGWALAAPAGGAETAPRRRRARRPPRHRGPPSLRTQRLQKYLQLQQQVLELFTAKKYEEAAAGLPRGRPTVPSRPDGYYNLALALAPAGQDGGRLRRDQAGDGAGLLRRRAHEGRRGPRRAREDRRRACTW